MNIITIKSVNPNAEWGHKMTTPQAQEIYERTNGRKIKIISVDTGRIFYQYLDTGSNTSSKFPSKYFSDSFTLVGKQLQTKEDWKNYIVELVTRKQGCKMIEIICDRKIHALECNPEKLVEELVDEGKIIEVEYVLPEMTYRVKSFLLPVGTTITVDTGD